MFFPPHVKFPYELFLLFFQGLASNLLDKNSHKGLMLLQNYKKQPDFQNLLWYSSKAVSQVLAPKPSLSESWVTELFM